MSSTLLVFQDEISPVKEVALENVREMFLTLEVSQGRLELKELLSQNICSISINSVVVQEERSPAKSLAPRVVER